MISFHSQNVPIIEDDMKITRVPLPSNDGGGLDDQCTIYS